MLKLMSKHLREDNSIKQDETIYMYIIRKYVDHVQENNAVVVVTPLGTRYIGLKERRNCSVRVRNSFSHSLPVRNDVSSFSYSIILFHLSNLIIMFVISLKIWPICITLLYNNPSKVTSTCMGHLYFFIHTRTLDCWFDFLVILFKLW